MNETAYAVVTEEMVAYRGMIIPRTIGHGTTSCPKIVADAIVTDDEHDDPWPCACIPVRVGGHQVGIDIIPEREGGAHVEREREVDITPTATDEEVVAAVRALPRGEKFSLEHVSAPLRKWATEWAKGYLERLGDDKPFEFMVEMHKAATERRSGLSAGQAKGVLNCFRADYWRAEMSKPKPSLNTSAAEQASAGAQVPDGTYTVVFGNGERRTLKVHTQDLDKSFKPGETLVSFLNGPDNWRNYKTFGTMANGIFRPFRSFVDSTALIEAVQVLQGDPRAAASAYGIASGKCGLCGRKLTVPESIEAGIGPICAANAGW